MNLRVTFALMLLFLALGSVSLFDPFHWKDKKAEKQERESHLFWIKDQRLESFSVTSNGARLDFNCKKTAGCGFDANGDWEISNPIKSPADASNIGSMLEALKTLSSEERIDLGEQALNMAEYGFDKPRIQVEFKLTGEKQIHFLKIGNKPAMETNLFAYTSEQDKKIFIIQNFFAYKAEKDLFYWRSKNLFFDLASKDIVSMAWGDYLFEKSNGAWQMKKPIEAKANFVVAEGLAALLANASARGIIASQKSQVAAIQKAKPVLRFKFSTEQKRTESLDLYVKSTNEADKYNYIASVDGREEAFDIDGVLFQRFRREAKEYRELHLLTSAELAAVEKVDFSFPRDKKNITLKKLGETYQYESGLNPPSAISVARVKDFLNSLSSLDLKDFPAKKAKKNIFAKIPDLQLTITGNQLSKVFHFVLDGPHLVLTEGENPSEYRSYGDDFLKLLPVRYVDLLESNNKQVLVKDADGKRAGSGSK